MSDSVKLSYLLKLFSCKRLKTEQETHFVCFHLRYKFSNCDRELRQLYLEKKALLFHCVRSIRHGLKHSAA